MKIEHIPTTPEGEIALVLEGDMVIVERRLYGMSPGVGYAGTPDRVSQIRVPADKLRELLEGEG